jgi:transcriptional regulator with XRE-family HTH domain
VNPIGPIGPIIAALRRQRGLSQVDLADLLGTSSARVSNWECGNNDPQWHAVCALADALGVSTEVFRGGKASCP